MKPTMRLTAVLLTSLLFGQAWGQVPARLPEAKAKAIESLIRTRMEQYKVPGLSAALVLDRELVWSTGLGLADLENQVPATAQTVYRLASVSKPITATAALQLVEQGKLDLDAPVQKYVPAFPVKEWPITTRQLLCHQAGIRHYRAAEATSTRRYANLTEPLDIFKNDPLLFEPGTKFSYSTYGYNLLGCVVEGASGRPFVAYCQEQIFQPAGMTTIRPDDLQAIIPHRASGYRKNAKGELENSALMDGSNKIPGGGFCSTAVDLARFAIALQKGRLLKKTLEEAWTRQKLRDGGETGYGLGWTVSTWKGKKVVAHTGGQARVSTVLFMIPEDGLAIAVMCNLEGSNLTQLAQQIVDELARAKAP